MRCQGFDEHGPVFRADGSTSVKRMCMAELTAWRSCGAGGNKCKEAFAFCDKHGGDAKAIELCQAHHAAHRPDPFCPEHGRASRPSHTPGLRCDCATNDWVEARAWWANVEAIRAGRAIVEERLKNNIVTGKPIPGQAFLTDEERAQRQQEKVADYTQRVVERGLGPDHDSLPVLPDKRWPRRSDV